MNAQTQAVVHSSKSEDWTTPKDLFDALHAEFSFIIDAAASSENALCGTFYTKQDNSLVQDWDLGPGYGAVWLNPPYGRGMYAWIKKASETAAQGRTVVCLLPVRTDVKWWHDFVQDKPGVEVRFVKGRLTFGGATKSGKPAPAPFPSVIVIFRGVSQ